jgi:hypothetical protein
VKEKSKVSPVSLSPFAFFDLDTGTASQEWNEPSTELVNMYKAKISKSLFPYQLKDEEWKNAQRDILGALHAVADEYKSRIEKGSKSAFHSYVIKTTLASATLNLLGESVNVSAGRQIENTSYTELEFDPRLLKRLILRKPNYLGFTQFHFNQAEIGSHIKWSRVGDYDDSSALLNFMQCQSTIE